MQRRKLTKMVALLVAAPVALAVPIAAQAADEWCDIDPPVIINTPKGNLVTVYDLISAKGLTASLLNELAVIDVAVQPANDGTATLVNMSVTVRRTLLTGSTPTKVSVTSGLWGTGTVYGSATGTAGTPMPVQFLLPVP